MVQGCSYNVDSRYILGMRVDYTTYSSAVEKIMRLAIDGNGGYLCIGNVHMVVEAYNNAEFRQVVNAAELVTPDGMPLVWGLRLLGIRNSERVCGSYLTPIICEEAQKRGALVGFYGGTEENLKIMLKKLQARFPSLNIAYAFSPPFRALTKEESNRVIKDIIESKVKILFVGLGCPKQEKWMAEQRSKIPAVMIGVGATFDFIAGKVKRAPKWMQNIGLEWLFRLLQEPKRLWKRYLVGNALFIYLVFKELMKKLITRRSDY